MNIYAKGHNTLSKKNGQGISAPGWPAAHAPFFKCILNIFKNVKKIQKMSHVYLDILHAHNVVSAKTGMFYAMCKKDKFW
jgi:hypothetical protein